MTGRGLSVFASEVENPGEEVSGNSLSSDGSLPSDEAPESGGAPESGEATDSEEVPATEETPATEEAPVSEEALSSDELPDPAEMPEAEELPSEEQLLTAELLSSGLEVLDDLEPGEDYIENGAYLLTDNEKEAEEAAEIYDARVVDFAEGVATLELEDDKSIDEVLKEFTETVSADSPELPIYPNVCCTLCTATGNPEFSSQWHHSSISSGDAWKLSRGSGVKVAVVDTGVNASHEDLSSPGHLYTYSVIDSAPADEDNNGHGTHIAGIIGALDNDRGGIGVSPEATLYSIRIDDSSNGKNIPVSNVIAGLNKAVSLGADVVNISLGTYSDDPNLKEAVENAGKEGVFITAAAGNSGRNKKMYPAAYSESLDNILAVGAYDSAGALSGFSNYGDWVDLAAPGSSILSSYRPDSDSYTTLSGTSMASPVAAGTAALVLSLNPGLTPSEVKSRLKNSDPEAVFSLGSRTVHGGLNAAAAVNAVSPGSSEGDDTVSDNPAGDTPESSAPAGESPSDPSGNEAPENTPSGNIPADSADPLPPKVPVKESEVPTLVLGVGNSIRVRRGKSVNLGAVLTPASKTKISYVGGNDRITVNSSGTVKVAKTASVGESAVVWAKWGSLSASVNVAVIDQNASSGDFSLRSSYSGPLSAAEGTGQNYTNIYVSGGNNDAVYRLKVSNKKAALFSGGLSTVSVKGSASARLYAAGNGSVTVTAYATDGSGKKSSLKLKCVTPLTGVSVTCHGEPVNGVIRLAPGASLKLSAAPLGSESSKVSGKTKYVWSGEHVKRGKIKAPKYDTSFEVSVRAENGGVSVSDRVRVEVSSSRKKAVLLGYYYTLDKGKYKYKTSGQRSDIRLGERIDNLEGLPKAWVDGVSLSPRLFYTKPSSGKKGVPQTDDASVNKGLYTVSVKSKNVKNVSRNDYGVTGFTPTKTGTYTIEYRLLDGSEKKFRMKVLVYK
ncbi:MAG: S8 family serine peptidase [Lachnospiraceae bacterium]|nr:S8 family serine peptidase [Lachnospiraceae bacterium]